MHRIIAALFFLVGLVNILPVAGVVSADMLARAYAIAPPDGDLLILMRHRAWLFGVIGALIVSAAFLPWLRLAALLAGLASMLGFVVLAVLAGDYGDALNKVVIVDVVASVVLVVAGILQVRLAGQAPG